MGASIFARVIGKQREIIPLPPCGVLVELEVDHINEHLKGLPLIGHPSLYGTAWSIPVTDDDLDIECHPVVGTVKAARLLVYVLVAAIIAYSCSAGVVILLKKNVPAG